MESVYGRVRMMQISKFKGGANANWQRVAVDIDLVVEQNINGNAEFVENMEKKYSNSFLFAIYQLYLCGF